ncbi:hypothetical protein AQUCO_05600012v1 [Aquilegia coerulea]|uniref:Alpha-galactosidase n=2 Tax=Aquilegia coerulea TaxID=218851 RepID=A0A2G5CG75_AQUCA|nr:hypothetical protein AQUCO_05600012v1 [Aquilegia coerulea]
MLPDPGRWPSSQGGKGFTEVADKVHAMGLKFGIHVMRGISTQAFNANTPILDPLKGGAYIESGKNWTARDIGLRERTCPWMSQGFMSVDTTLGAGRAFLRSLYRQYADWGVDFVKNDCVFGDNLEAHEIDVVSKVLQELDRPMLYSLSPGVSATPNMANGVGNLVNMYRITGDDWDSWEDVEAHFNVSRDFAAANLIGAKGLRGKSWPDLDMLPLGWLTDPGSNQGPQRKCNLSFDEQKTQMTLWSMVKSPLMFGGDMRKLDGTTYSIITNPILLEINSYSTDNREFSYISGTEDLRSSNHVLTRQTRNLKEVKAEASHVPSLTSCRHAEAKGWTFNFDGRKASRICWKDKYLGRKSKAPFCLHTRKPLFTLEDKYSYKQKYQGKLQLLANETDDSCLNASPIGKLSSRETKRMSFSHCKLNEDQIWELNQNGTLMNSYSGLCATVTAKEANGSGIRSWIATGRRGEVYLSFFNLNPGRMVISANISDLAKALPSRPITISSCKYTEVWNGNDYGVATDTISIAVDNHGCALFVLQCN